MARLGAFVAVSGAKIIASSIGGEAFGILATVIAVLLIATMAVAVCAQSVSSRKSRNCCRCKCHNNQNTFSSMCSSPSSSAASVHKERDPPKSPLRAIVSSMSGKKLPWGRSKSENGGDPEVRNHDRKLTEDEEFLWQRTILMGEKCQPPDFSGVIIYDEKGNMLPSFPPRSPRTYNFPSFQTTCDVR